jgi:hypothetical protein
MGLRQKPRRMSVTCRLAIVWACVAIAVVACASSRMEVTADKRSLRADYNQSVI